MRVRSRVRAHTLAEVPESVPDRKRDAFSKVSLAAQIDGWVVVLLSPALGRTPSDEGRRMP